MQPNVITWYNRQGEMIGDNGTLWDGAQVTDNSDHDDENDDIATSAQLPALLLNGEGVVNKLTVLPIPMAILVL